MDRFSFVMVLLSIIVGLGVTELLTNLARQIKRRETTKFYWLHTCVVVFVFVALLQQWWEMWGLQGVNNWNFPILLLMLGGPVALYLISHLLFPSEFSGVNFRAYYYDNARVIWTIGIIAIVLSVSFRPISFGVRLFDLQNASSFAGLVVFAALASTRNRLVHEILAPLVFAGLLLDILVFAMSLR